MGRLGGDGLAGSMVAGAAGTKRKLGLLFYERVMLPDE
jgi:hypothetical protein